jgi:hypothetical protein
MMRPFLGLLVSVFVMILVYEILWVKPPLDKYMKHTLEVEMYLDCIIAIRDVEALVVNSPHLFNVDFDGEIVRPLELTVSIMSTPLGFLGDDAFSYVRVETLPDEFELLVSAEFEGQTTWEAIQRQMAASEFKIEFCQAFGISPDEFHLPHIIK